MRRRLRSRETWPVFLSGTEASAWRSFEERLSARKAQYEEVSKRLDGLARQVVKLTAQLAILHPS
jgi:hypothetical protein